MVRVLAGMAVFGLSAAMALAQAPPPDNGASPPAPSPAPALQAPPLGLPPAAMNPPMSADQWPTEPPISCIVPGGPRPGFFGAVDFSVLFPHVQHNVSSTVPINYNGVFVDFPPFAPPRPMDTVNLPFAPQDATLAPKFTLGWRFSGERGGIQLTYRNIASEGDDWISNFDAAGDGALRSRLDLNEVGLNYTTSEHPLGALWSMRLGSWRAPGDDLSRFARVWPSPRSEDVKLLYRGRSASRPRPHARNSGHGFCASSADSMPPTISVGLSKNSLSGSAIREVPMASAIPSRTDHKPFRMSVCKPV